MKRIIVSLFVLTIVTTLVAQTPQAKISKATEIPVIDGKLTEKLWQRQPDFKDFKIIKSGKPADSQTEAWAGVDSGWLYLAFKCHDPKPEAVVCKVKDRDKSVHNDDSVEIFLSPGTGGKTYYHFMVNTAGIQGDNRSEDFGAIPHEWDAYWRSAATVDKANKCWYAEIAVPLFYLTRNHGSETWKFNLCRTKAHDGKEYSSWASMKNSFHEPKSFGAVTGLENLKAAPLFAPVVVKSEVGALQDLPARCYPVKLILRNDGNLAGKAAAYIIDTTDEKTGKTAPLEVVLDPLQAKEFSITVPIESFEQRKTRYVVGMSDKLGKWNSSSEIKSEKVIKPLQTFTERNYYTSEKKGKIVYIVNIPETLLAKSKIEVKLPNGKKIGGKLVRSAGRYEFSLEDIADGVYQAKASLIGPGGKIIAEENCELRKLSPVKAGNETKLDRWRRCVLLNGKPFFPIGFYKVTPASFKMLKDMGFNTVIPWNKFSQEESEKYVDEAWKNGLYVFHHPVLVFKGTRHRNYSMFDPKLPKNTKRAVKEDLPELIERCAQKNALIAWYGYDEPGFEHGRIACNIMADAIRKLDPYHIVTPLFCRQIRHNEGWRNSFDIILIDLYLKFRNNPELTFHELKKYVDWLKLAKVDLTALNIPFWATILNESNSGTTRTVLPREQRVNTYLALIFEATGIFYFIWPVTHVDNARNFKVLTGEIAKMEPALLTRTPEQKLAVTGANPYMIHALLKKRPEGGFLLIAVNMMDIPCDVKISIPGLKAKTAVSRMFGKGQYKVSGNSFSEHWRGYETRAYVIENSDINPERPIDIKITASNLPKLKKVSAGSMNLIPNGNFEEAGKWHIGGAKGAMSFVKQEHKNGKSSLFIDRKQGMPTVTAISEEFKLKPETKYQLSFWAKGDFKSFKPRWGGPSINIYNRQKRKTLTSRQTHAQQLKKWKEHKVSFKTGREPESAVCIIYGYSNKFTGKAWIDNVRLVELGGNKKSRNLLPNSGFEIATVKKLPDRWRSNPWLPVNENNMTGLPGALITLDDKEVHEGKYSLRLKGMHQLYDNNCWFGPEEIRCPKLDENKTYVFSAYVKADREDVEVWMRIMGPKKQKYQKFKVGKKWKRISVTGKPRVFRYRGALMKVQFRTEGAAGLPTPLNDRSREKMKEKDAALVWVDAMQFEEGTKPTEYVKDDFTERNLKN